MYQKQRKWKLINNEERRWFHEESKENHQKKGTTATLNTQVDFKLPGKTFQIFPQKISKALKDYALEEYLYMRFCNTWTAGMFTQRQCQPAICESKVIKQVTSSPGRWKKLKTRKIASLEASLSLAVGAIVHSFKPWDPVANAVDKNAKLTSKKKINRKLRPIPFQLNQSRRCTAIMTQVVERREKERKVHRVASWTLQRKWREKQKWNSFSRKQWGSKAMELGKPVSGREMTSENDVGQRPERETHRETA